MNSDGSTRGALLRAFQRWVCPKSSHTSPKGQRFSALVLSYLSISIRVDRSTSAMTTVAVVRLVATRTSNLVVKSNSRYSKLQAAEGGVYAASKICIKDSSSTHTVARLSLTMRLIAEKKHRLKRRRPTSTR